ncbi:osmoprotectant transporter ProQ [[Haemophilus] ducreyi]|uniref:RNA chaperone ProQ n=1 Tax=Haemophilus ducreyi TaxID=730 RepID=UPI000654BF06|nr:RNA chaperone ProQ [[Haemophilus] ducreyi]AKO39687.1 osmoprotectant transporter ProQ [[Haemophilus] ducreyi]
MSVQPETMPDSSNKTNPTVKEVIAYLADKFPLCFSIEREAKPLKVGLSQDLAEALADDEKVSKTLLRQVLRSYTMSWRYLACCKANAQRIGLQGENVGIVDEAQAEHAAQSLAVAKEAYAARKAEQRKEQRKDFFKKKAREERNAKTMNKAVKKGSPKKDTFAKATAESLAVLTHKFSKGNK